MNKQIDDDAFHKASSDLTDLEREFAKLHAPYANFPQVLKSLPCSKWTRNTWGGLAAIFSGACFQFAFGVINIWGAVVVYFTSKFRNDDPSLLFEQTLFVFPLTYVAGSVSMQVGAYLFRKIDLRL